MLLNHPKIIKSPYDADWSDLNNKLTPHFISSIWYTQDNNFHMQHRHRTHNEKW